MITVEKTTDLALVRGVFTHPDVWPHVSDDATAPVDEWEPVDSDQVHYLLIRSDDQVAGCFVLHPQTAYLWELHTAVLPEFRGEGTTEAGKQMLAWCFANTPANRLQTWVPAYNRKAAVAAKRAGFTECGKHPAAYLKDDVFHDLTLYGVSKCPSQQ